MTQEQIQEGNKIIAEFMGNNYVNRQLPPWAFRLYDFDTLGYDGYQYHKSFDWLIPVIDKICNTTFKSEIGAKFYPIVDIEIGHTSFSRSTMWSMGEKRIFVSRCTGETMVEHCWYAVIDAINFYNKYSDK